MRATRSSWLLSLSSGVYEQMLKFYPRSYRTKYGQDMVRTFGDSCHFAVKERGFFGLFELWIPTMFDFSLTVVAKHLDEGLLSSGTLLFRVFCMALLAAASVLFAISWGTALGLMALGAGLLILGGLGLFVTSSEGQAVIARKLGMVENAYDREQTNQNLGRWTMTEKLERDFLRWWVAASGLGLVVGFAIFFMLVANLAEDFSFGPQLGVSLVSGLMLGGAIGLAQWLVLRRQVSQTNQWILASSLGGAVGAILSLLLRVATGEIGGFNGSLTLGALAVGASIGAAEWFILRHYVSRAGWWILASAAGLLVAIPVSNMLGRVLYDGTLPMLGDTVASLLAMVMFGGLLLLGYGSITGMVMRGFLKQMGSQSIEAKAS